MKSRSVTIAAVLLAASIGALPVFAGLVEDYGAYPGEAQGTEVTVKVDGQTVFVHRSIGSTQCYVHFSFTGQVTIAVTGDIQVSTVSPRMLGVPASRSGNTLTFTINKPFNYVIRRDNTANTDQPLLAIFAEAPMGDTPKPGDQGVRTAASLGIDNTGAADVSAAINNAITSMANAGGGTLLLGKGIYIATIQLKSNVYLWLDAGVRIRRPSGGGSMVINHSGNNCGIRGHGSLEGGTWVLSGVTNSSNEGVIVLNSPGWTVHIKGCAHVEMQGIRIINDPASQYDDQFDINGSSFVTLDNCYACGGDDAVAIKDAYGAPIITMDSITVRNTTLWTYSCTGIKVGATGEWHEAGWVVLKNLLWENTHIVFAGGTNFSFEIESSKNENFTFINSSSESWRHRFFQCVGSPSGGATFKNIRIENYAAYQPMTFYFPGAPAPQTYCEVGNDITFRCLRVGTNGDQTINSANEARSAGITMSAVFLACATSEDNPGRTAMQPCLKVAAGGDGRLLLRVNQTGGHVVSIVRLSGAVIRRFSGAGPHIYMLEKEDFSGDGIAIITVSAGGKKESRKISLRQMN